jgi:hybrid cluster-associated redox disulfide protein
VCERDINNPDLTLEDMFRYWPDTATVFFNYKMRCVGCPIVAFHTIADACAAYDFDLDAFGAKLRQVAAGSAPELNPHPRSKPSGGDRSP